MISTRPVLSASRHTCFAASCDTTPSQPMLPLNRLVFSWTALRSAAVPTPRHARLQRSPPAHGHVEPGRHHYPFAGMSLGPASDSQSMLVGPASQLSGAGVAWTPPLGTPSHASIHQSHFLYFLWFEGSPVGCPLTGRLAVVSLHLQGRHPLPEEYVARHAPPQATSCYHYQGQ